MTVIGADSSVAPSSAGRPYIVFDVIGDLRTWATSWSTRFNAQRLGHGATIKRTHSERIQALRFPLIVGVVFLHAYGLSLDAVTDGGTEIEAHWTGQPLAFFVETLISQVWFRTAVPLMMLIAGYFLYRGEPFSVRSWRQKLRTRVQTLLVPYVIWNGLEYFRHLYAESRRGVRPEIGLNLPDLLGAVGECLGLTSQYPPDYPLWFIRDLMIFVVVSPLIWWSLRYLGFVVIAALAIVWLRAAPGAAGSHGFSTETLLFFSLGVWLAQRNSARLLLPDSWALPIIYLATSVAEAGWITCNYKSAPIILHDLNVLLGVGAVWRLSRYALYWPRIKELLTWLASFSFFVFAAHSYPLIVIRRFAESRIGTQTSGQLLMIYVGSALLATMGTLALAAMLRRGSPAVFAKLSGNR